MRAELFHADGRTDMKQIVAFGNFASAPKQPWDGIIFVKLNYPSSAVNTSEPALPANRAGFRKTEDA
jgi:hypothetical protein